jgi:hypothetical protein
MDFTSQLPDSRRVPLAVLAGQPIPAQVQRLLADARARVPVAQFNASI